MRRKLTLILLAVVALALLSAPGTWTNQATSCTAASYAALPVGMDDGDTCQDTSTGMVWLYDASTALWLYPWMNPAATLNSYNGTGMPSAGGWSIAWQAGAGEGNCASAGGELTCAMSAGQYADWKITDAVNFTTAKNFALLVRAKVTVSAGVLQQKFFIGMYPNSSASTAMTIAWTAGVSDVGAVANFKQTGATPNASPDNGVYQWWYVAYRASSRSFSMGVLGQPVLFGLADYDAGAPGTIAVSTVNFGSYTTVACTFVVDQVYVFNF